MGFLDDLNVDFSMPHWREVSVMPYTHVHRHYELYFCVDNVRQISVINGTEYTYKFPSAVLSTPYTVHSMSCDDADAQSYERYVFSLSEQGFESIVSLLPSKLSERNVGLLFELTEKQADALKNIIHCCDPNESQTPLTEQKLIFALILNKLFDYCEESKIIQVGKPSFYIQKVVQYIAENFREFPDAEELAHSFAVSRSKLDRDFKQITGLTVHQFVELCRINHAKILLGAKNVIPIEEISAAVGIDSVNYFFPFFKKHTGMTPAEYRIKSMQKPQTR